MRSGEQYHPIGVFDSGFGGMTVLRELVEALPRQDFLYLGDNARTPYGTRSFETVYGYTREAVRWLFAQGCHLVILACNTASAKALRTLQQHDLLPLVADHRILGVIRPVSEVAGSYSKSGHLGLLATPGTVKSASYAIEIAKSFPQVQLHAEACALWVPLVENNEIDSPGTDYFVRKHIEALFAREPRIDTLILGCTHYPLLKKSIERFLPGGVQLIDQGKLVAEGLVDYLARHPEIACHCSCGGSVRFFTTDSPESFDEKGELFFGKPVSSQRAEL